MLNDTSAQFPAVCKYCGLRYHAGALLRRGAVRTLRGDVAPAGSNALPFARRRSQRRTTTRRAAAQRHARARARAGVTQLFHRPLPAALAAIRHCLPAPAALLSPLHLGEREVI